MSNFQLLYQTRRNFLEAIKDLSIEEINKVPANFNNNIVWNLGHILVTQQILCYQLAGAKPKLDTSRFESFRKGTKPEAFIDLDMVEEMKMLAEELIAQFEEDFNNGVFSQYSPYLTSYGVELTSIDDAIKFVAVHEALHYGYVLALKRAIK